MKYLLPEHDELTTRPLLAKAALIDGEYYMGRCRNACIARWSAEHQCFFHWREKFGRVFTEQIKHPVDDLVFDVFRPIEHLATCKFTIPFESFMATGTHPLFTGDLTDLREYEAEVWKRPAVWGLL